MTQTFMTRYEIDEKNLPNYAKHKQNQRHWNKMQREEARQRKIMYWKEIHRIEKQRSAVCKKLLAESRLSDSDPNAQLSINNQENPESKINNISVASILAHFSPQAEHQRETQIEFNQAMSIAISNLLPLANNPDDRHQRNHQQQNPIKP